MCSTFLGVDVVGIGIDDFVIRVVILKTYLNFVNNFTFFVMVKLVEINRAGEECLFVYVQILHKLNNSTFKFKAVILFFALASIFQGDNKPFIQKSNFAEAVFEGVIVKFHSFKNFWVWPKGDGCSALICGANHFQWRNGFSASKLNEVMFAILIDISSEFCGKSVNAGNTNAVKSARDFVSLTTKFTTSMKFC